MKKKIYVCPKCGRALNFSNNPEYTFACLDCEEDFYMYEAKEIEQPRMEGVVDYTELSRAYAQVKEITDSAIKVNNKFIEVKGKNILEQIAEYVNETLRPIFDAGMHEDNKFRSSAAIYTSGIRLVFTNYLIGDKRYQAGFMCNGNTYIYFNTDHEYCIQGIGNENLRWIVKNWSGLKDSMNRMIPYAIKECNNANKRTLAKQEEEAELINSFRL